jgi:hypothetical protein
MQLQKSELSLHISAPNAKTIDFDIDKENIGLILETLRSKMYSDPIMAICREVASNSRDANREAGNLKPTEILVLNNSVWTENTPVIVFRDNGPGIDPQRMVDVFVKFGASTKRHTNNLTGGFGYGAKTPFAYTDTFYIKTIVNSVEYVYVCALDETKKGKLILITENASIDPNGTEIIVPLKTHDVDKFKKSALFATYFWDVRPIYKGFDSEVEAFKAEVCQENTSEYYIGKPFADFKGAYALIDGIPYPLSTGNFEQRVNYNLSEILVLLKFNNGDLPVSTNRETIIVNDNSNALISKKANGMLKNYRTYITTRLSDLEKNANFHDMLFEFKKLSNDEKSVFSIFNVPFKYGNYAQDGRDIFPLEVNFTTIEKRSMYRRRRGNGKFARTSFRDFMWSYKNDIKQVTFLLNDIDSQDSRIKTLHENNVEFCIVDMPDRQFADLEAERNVSKMTQLEYDQLRKERSWLDRDAWTPAKFQECLEEEAVTLKNFDTFCSIYKPQTLSSIMPYKVVRSKPSQRVEHLTVAGMVVTPKNKYDQNDYSLDVKTGALEHNGKAFKGYVVFVNSTNRKFDKDTYYIRRSISGNKALFDQDVLFLPNNNKRVVRIVSKNHTVLSSREDFEKVIDAENVVDHYLSVKRQNHRSFIEVTEALNLNNYLDYLTPSEIAAATHKSSECSFVGCNQIDLDWEKYQALALKKLNLQLKTTQCIIVKSKPLFVLNATKTHLISADKLERIKQILLS